MTEIFALLAVLPDVPKPLNRLPGCYERDLPDGWHVSVNAHREPMNGGSENHGVVVPPFHAMFTHAETLEAALVSPFEGSTLFDCEDRIVAALQKAGAVLPAEEAWQP